MTWKTDIEEGTERHWWRERVRDFYLDGSTDIGDQEQADERRIYRVPALEEVARAAELTLGLLEEAIELYESYGLICNAESKHSISCGRWINAARDAVSDHREALSKLDA